MPIETWNHFRPQFLLNPEITFLNHGSFGATPKPVFERYQQWQLELEREPVDFLGRRADCLLQPARETLASYLGTHANHLVFITNATTGMNMVARSIELGPGDEVLTSTHEYGAIDRTWRFLAREKGFKLVRQPTSLPFTTDEAWLDEFWQGVTARTKVISLSHITSPTAVTFPIQKVCQRAREVGILTVIDGAHAPGQIPLNLHEIDADFYTGNLHKWLCAPKGSAFLYSHPSQIDQLKPFVVSWGYESANPGPNTLIDYNQWAGTRDISAFLTVPDAIQFCSSEAFIAARNSCREQASQALETIAAITGQTSLYPPRSTWFTQMVSAPLPTQTDTAALAAFLWEKRRIEIPVIDWNGLKFVRVSVQVYNSPADYDQLYQAIKDFFRL